MLVHSKRKEFTHKFHTWILLLQIENKKLEIRFLFSFLLTFGRFVWISWTWNKKMPNCMVAFLCETIIMSEKAFSFTPPIKRTSLNQKYYYYYWFDDSAIRAFLFISINNLLSKIRNWIFEHYLHALHTHESHTNHKYFPEF